MKIKHTAISDIAKLLVDNDWEPTSDDTWTKDTLTVCLYVGEYGAHDYDDVEFDVTDVNVKIYNNKLLVSFVFEKEKYDNVITDSEDIEDFIAYGILPDDFNNELVDALTASISGDLTDRAYESYYR